MILVAVGLFLASVTPTSTLAASAHFSLLAQAERLSPPAGDSVLREFTPRATIEERIAQLRGRRAGPILAWTGGGLTLVSLGFLAAVALTSGQTQLGAILTFVVFGAPIGGVGLILGIVGVVLWAMREHEVAELQQQLHDHDGETRTLGLLPPSPGVVLARF